MGVNLVQLFEKNQITKLSEGKSIPDVRPGCTVKIMGKTKEGNTERFEGVCIKRRNRGLATSITLRKLSANNEYVEKTFNIYSPRIDTITVLKRGRVRRAKLYYMRDRIGRAARIQEINTYDKKGANKIAAEEIATKTSTELNAEQAAIKEKAQEVAFADAAPAKKEEDVAAKEKAEKAPADAPQAKKEDAEVKAEKSAEVKEKVVQPKETEVKGEVEKKAAPKSAEGVKSADKKKTAKENKEEDLGEKSAEKKDEE